MREVLDEAEAAGRLLETVEAHDQSLDLTALAEQLIDLLLGREEGKISHVERRRFGEGVLGLGLDGGGVVTIAIVAAARLELINWVGSSASRD